MRWVENLAELTAALLVFGAICWAVEKATAGAARWLARRMGVDQ